MISNLIGKSTSEAFDIIENFKNMIDEKSFDEKKIGEGIVYQDISKQPNRKNCALLTWRGMQELIEKKEK